MAMSCQKRYQRQLRKSVRALEGVRSWTDHEQRWNYFSLHQHWASTD